MGPFLLLWMLKFVDMTRPGQQQPRILICPEPDHLVEMYLIEYTNYSSSSLYYRKVSLRREQEHRNSGCNELKKTQKQINEISGMGT